MMPIFSFYIIDYKYCLTRGILISKTIEPPKVFLFVYGGTLFDTIV